MNSRLRFIGICTLALYAALFLVSCSQQPESGYDSITDEELKTHLQYIASDEMKGRDTPSPELKKAAEYLAEHADDYGYEPLPSVGSLIQEIPLWHTPVDPANSSLTVGGTTFSYPESFGGSFSRPGSVSGNVVFAGYGLSAPDLGWDDYNGIDVNGKVVVVLDGQLPENHELMKRENRRALYGRTRHPQQNGAVALLQVISPEEEAEISEFSTRDRAFWSEPELSEEGTPFFRADIRHEVARELLGVTDAQLKAMFDKLSRGEQVAAKNTGKTAALKVALTVEENHTQNVIAYLEGTDPELKNEYIVIGAHYDHVGTRNGEVYNGADDDGSGTVALLEIAEAMAMERPKRSVIFGWWTGEEKGLRGARYFVNNETVPLDRISAMLQIDMCSRNAPDSIYVIGSHFLSDELEEVNQQVYQRINAIHLNQWFNDQNFDGNNYHRQSDHYAFYQAGIPAIFFFSGVHEDLHSPTDTWDKCDFVKMENVSKHVFELGKALANHPTMMALDEDAGIESRGLHNMQRR